MAQAVTAISYPVVVGAGGTGQTSGGSGIVIIRYEGASAGTGGTITTDAGDTVHTFTTTGNSSFNLTGLNLNTRLGLTLSSAITGTGAFTFDGPGLLTLSASNSYSGPTTVSAGTLSLSNTSALAGSTFSGGSGSLSFGSLTAASFGGLSGSSNLALSNTSPAAVALSVGANNQTTTFSGSLSGLGSFQKVGSGTLTLAGASDYSGGTTVTEGVLKVNGSIASSAVTVQIGATLAGSGTVGGMTLQAGSTLSPGNSPGTTSSTSTVTWLAGADYNWQVYNTAGTAGSDWDFLSIAGDLDLTNLNSLNRFDINLWSLSAVNADVDGDALNFDNTQAGAWTIARVTGDGSILGFASNQFNVIVSAANGTSGFSNSLGGGSFSMQQSGSDLNLVFAPVPEPTGLALVTAAIAVACGLRRRCR